MGLLPSTQKEKAPGSLPAPPCTTGTRQRFPTTLFLLPVPVQRVPEISLFRTIAFRRLPVSSACLQQSVRTVYQRASETFWFLPAFVIEGLDRSFMTASVCHRSRFEPFRVTPPDPSRFLPSGLPLPVFRDWCGSKLRCRPLCCPGTAVGSWNVLIVWVSSGDGKGNQPVDTVDNGDCISDTVLHRNISTPNSCVNFRIATKTLISGAWKILALQARHGARPFAAHGPVRRA